MFVCAYKKTSTEEEVKAKLRTLKLGKGAPPNKVTVICDALLPVFKKLDASTNNKYVWANFGCRCKSFNKVALYDRYLLCTITALVRREPPQIEEALKFVQQLRGTVPPCNNCFIRLTLMVISRFGSRCRGWSWQAIFSQSISVNRWKGTEVFNFPRWCKCSLWHCIGHVWLWLGTDGCSEITESSHLSFQMFKLELC